MGSAAKNEHSSWHCSFRQCLSSCFPISPPSLNLFFMPPTLMRIASNRCSPGEAPVWVMATPISRPCWYLTAPCKQITSRVKGQGSKNLDRNYGVQTDIWPQICIDSHVSEVSSHRLIETIERRFGEVWMRQAAARKVTPFWIHFKFRPAVHRRQISNDWHGGEKRLKSICQFFLPSRGADRTFLEGVDPCSLLPVSKVTAENVHCIRLCIASSLSAMLQWESCGK